MKTVIETKQSITYLASCKKISVSPQRYYRWRREYCCIGMILALPIKLTSTRLSTNCSSWGCDQDEQRFLIVEDRVLFGDGGEGLPQRQFLEASLLRSRDQVGAWYSRPEKALFCSSLISVNKDRYRQALERIKSEVLKMQTDLDCNEADGLVSFNVQIYPYEPQERR